MLHFKNIGQIQEYKPAPCSLVLRLKLVLLPCEIFYWNIKIKGGKFHQQNKSGRCHYLWWPWSFFRNREHYSWWVNHIPVDRCTLYVRDPLVGTTFPYVELHRAEAVKQGCIRAGSELMPFSLPKPVPPWLVLYTLGPGEKVEHLCWTDGFPSPDVRATFAILFCARKLTGDNCWARFPSSTQPSQVQPVCGTGKRTGCKEDPFPWLSLSLQGLGLSLAKFISHPCTPRALALIRQPLLTTIVVFGF